MSPAIRIASRRLFGSNLTMAIALACGAAVGVTSFDAPAFAQRDKKKKKKSGKADYSKGFAAVYQPLAEQVNSGVADPATLAAGVPGLVAVLSTPDDKNAGGNLIYSIGLKAQDKAIQLQGLGIMLDSGKAGPERLGALNFAAGQLAYQLDDFAGSRRYMLAAAAAGYTANDPQAFVAETYFGEEQYGQGVNYLKNAINERVAAGADVPNEWIRRGLAMSYNNDLNSDAQEFAALFARHNGTQEAWSDAIAVVLNTGGLEPQEVLDLLRLARKTDAMKDRLYAEYVETADARRLPGEVLEVIQEGVSAGMLDGTDPFIIENKEIANRQVVADRADLPAIKRDAEAANASVLTVMGAGDAFLSYNQPDVAEPMFAKALAMPGVDTDRILTRLGIAQTQLGKYTAAKETFARVGGRRVAVARLWTVYADQQAASTPAATVAAAPAPAG